MKELDLVAVLNKTFEFYGRMLRETAAVPELSPNCPQNVPETEEDLRAFSNDMDLADWEADHAEPHSLNRRVDYDSD